MKYFSICSQSAPSLKIALDAYHDEEISVDRDRIDSNQGSN